VKNIAIHYVIATRAGGDFGLNEPPLTDEENEQLQRKVRGDLAREISRISFNREYSRLGLLVTTSTKIEQEL
jgi:hypothetical protein